MIKTIILTALRIALIASPAYSLYIFANGEGANKDMGWWMDQAGYIAWALGAYVLLFFCTFKFRITYAQIAVLAIGCAGLAYFFHTEDVYAAFLTMPYFQENKKLLPIIPYLFTVIIIVLHKMLKFRPGRG